MWKWIGFGFGLFLVAGIVIFLIAFYQLKPKPLKFTHNDPEAATKLDDWFTRLNEADLKLFNGVVYIRRGNEILLKKGYGIDAQGRELSVDSPLRLASVSKQFTAVGVLTLVHEGKVDLDEPISTYLPMCKFDGATVRSLLNHTSGIPDNYMSLAGDDLLTLEGLEALICQSSEDVTLDPKFSYSNTGYALAARLIERVSGQSFEDYMQNAVFDPLGMRNSRVWNLVSTRPFPERAAGFDMHSDKRPEKKPTNLDGIAGDGGVFSTLNDLENWDRFWMDERLLPRAMKDEAMALESGGYGFGLIREGDIVWHNGRWLAANSLIRKNIKNGDLIILIDNGESLSFDAITKELQKFLGE